MDAVLAQIDKDIGKMVDFASNGTNHTLTQASAAFPAVSNAGGYRSAQLQNAPWFERQAIDDLEDNWAFNGLSLVYYGEEWIASSLPNCVFDNERWNTGNGDVWVRNEILRLQYLKLRIRDIYLGSQ
jgi:hypothetical protein